VARDDPEASLRVLAIRRLTDAEVARHLGALSRSGTQPHRTRRPPLQTDPAQRGALSALHDPSALARLARESGDPETRRRAITRVGTRSRRGAAGRRRPPRERPREARAA